MAALLRYNADENARDKNWQTPAHVAASNNAVRCMEKLLPRLSNVNITDRAGRTCLHMAAYSGHYDMVELLLGEGGASANHTDKRDRSAAHWAAFMGHEDVVRLQIAYCVGSTSLYGFLAFISMRRPNTFERTKYNLKD